MPQNVYKTFRTAAFISDPNQTHLNHLFDVFTITRNIKAGVCLALNSAGQWPSSIKRHWGSERGVMFPRLNVTNLADQSVQHCVRLNSPNVHGHVPNGVLHVDLRSRDHKLSVLTKSSSQQGRGV